MSSAAYPVVDLSKCSKTSMQTFVYDYPWEMVVSSYFLRFPMHPKLPILLETQIISDHIDPASQRRLFVRKCTIDVDAPGCAYPSDCGVDVRFLKRIIGVSAVVFIQTTLMDYKTRTMVI
jgi:hypothetical protein